MNNFCFTILILLMTVGAIEANEIAKTSISAASTETLKSLPEPTGPYIVGIAKYDLTDPYRKEIEYPKGRLIPIQIYFPMQEGKHVIHSKIFENRVPGPWKPLAVEVYGQKADISSLIAGSHPVILLNHGDTVSMTDYASIAEDLASNILYFYFYPKNERIIRKIPELMMK